MRLRLDARCLGKDFEQMPGGFLGAFTHPACLSALHRSSSSRCSPQRCPPPSVEKASYGTVAINTKEYASPVYVAGKDDPVVSVGYSTYHKSYVPKDLLKQWDAVPSPAYAEAADGTTATSLPFLGGQITVEEMKAGRIDHAIGITLVDLEHYTIYSWPADRSDGSNPQKVPNRIPEGLRFRLDPTVDVDALKMHTVGKTLARAAQKYGFVVWDKAGAITLRAENPKGHTLAGQPNPYPEIFYGTPAYALLNGMPWDKLQFLPMHYGKTKP